MCGIWDPEPEPDNATYVKSLEDAMVVEPDHDSVISILHNGESPLFVLWVSNMHKRSTEGSKVIQSSKPSLLFETESKVTSSVPSHCSSNMTATIYGNTKPSRVWARRRSSRLLSSLCNTTHKADPDKGLMENFTEVKSWVFCSRNFFFLSDSTFAILHAYFTLRSWWLMD